MGGQGPTLHNVMQPSDTCILVKHARRRVEVQCRSFVAGLASALSLANVVSSFDACGLQDYSRDMVPSSLQKLSIQTSLQH